MNELTKIDKNTISTIEKNGIADLVKPLTREIHLFDTFVAGTSHIEDKTVFDDLRIEDELVLVREDNKFDTNAILIKNINNKKLGYIPEKDNVIFSRLMDAGKLLKARIKNIENLKCFTKIQISIFLFDF